MKKTLIAALALVLWLCAVPALAEDCWYYANYGAHDYEQVDVRKPTCTQDGYYLLECRICGKNKKETTQAAYGHDWRKTGETSATCTTRSTVSYECRNCNKTKTEKGSSLGHAYGAWQISQPAGDFSMGVRYRVCASCSNVAEEAFYPEGTLYRGAGDRDAVMEMQQKLQDLGYLRDKVDGIFGKNTEQAVRDYAAVAGFPVDGVAWPTLLSGLNVDWEVYMGGKIEPGESEFESNTLVDFCMHGLDGEWLMCANHARMQETAETLYRAAATEAEQLRALKQIRALWKGELDILYETWLEGASEQEMSLALSGKATFASYLATQETIWKQQYGADSPSVLEQVIAALQEQCRQICALAGGAPAE